MAKMTQEWDQGGRKPSVAARSLLKIAARRPEVLHEVFADLPSPPRFFALDRGPIPLRGDERGTRNDRCVLSHEVPGISTRKLPQ